MTPEEERELLDERDFLRKEVGYLSEQVRLVVRAEHALTRSRRLVDRQLSRIRRLAALALKLAGSEALFEILEHARDALLDFFDLDDAIALRCDGAGTRSLSELCFETPGVVGCDTPQAELLLRYLVERGTGPALGTAPRVLVWVPLKSRTNETLALLVAWSSRTSAHHRELPRAEHLPFLELFGSHVTRALDNAALTAELRLRNEQLSASLKDLELAQAQLVQAQKLEALGRLAGGIAHDFNNLLTLIVGAADSLRLSVAATPETREDLAMIMGATKRGTAITRRLLAFGRQQEHHEELVALNALTMDLSRLLRRLIADEISLKLDLDTRVRPVRADPVQLEQIIMNLVLNARDAMPDGGTLTIETRPVPAHERPEGLPGDTDMVALRVTDTGTGFDETIRRQLFDPFFTTKPVGKGTGLGLATVYGLVNQHKGHISVRSAPGEGAEFTVFLPVAAAGPDPLESAPPEAAPRGTILIAEDEDGIRRMLARSLRRYGFEVHEARDGLDALELERKLQRLDLVVTDVVMPGMRGPELVRRLRETRPRLPVVFASGHTFDSLDTGALDPEIDCFLPKPFTAAELKAAVEKLLSTSLRARPVEEALA